MIIFGILLSLGILASMIYLALSKKSSFAIRLVSLIALALMIVAVIICLFIIFANPTSLVEESSIPIENPIPMQAKEGSSSIVLLLLMIMLLVSFAIIFISFRKEHKNSIKK
jgi:hypothetical protein